MTPNLVIAFIWLVLSFGGVVATGLVITMERTRVMTALRDQDTPVRRIVLAQQLRAFYARFFYQACSLVLVIYVLALGNITRQTELSVGLIVTAVLLIAPSLLFDIATFWDLQDHSKLLHAALEQQRDKTT